MRSKKKTKQVVNEVLLFWLTFGQSGVIGEQATRANMNFEVILVCLCFLLVLPEHDNHYLSLIKFIE